MTSFLKMIFAPKFGVESTFTDSDGLIKNICVNKTFIDVKESSDTSASCRESLRRTCSWPLPHSPSQSEHGESDNSDKEQAAPATPPRVQQLLFAETPQSAEKRRWCDLAQPALVGASACQPQSQDAHDAPDTFKVFTSTSKSAAIQVNDGAQSELRRFDAAEIDSAPPAPMGEPAAAGPTLRRTITAESLDFPVYRGQSLFQSENVLPTQLRRGEDLPDSADATMPLKRFDNAESHDNPEYVGHLRSQASAQPVVQQHAATTQAVQQLIAQHYAEHMHQVSMHQAKFYMTERGKLHAESVQYGERVATVGLRDLRISFTTGAHDPVKFTFQDVSSLEDLSTRLSENLNQKLSTSSLRYLDPDFTEWMQVTDLHALPDKVKMRTLDASSAPAHSMQVPGQHQPAEQSSWAMQHTPDNSAMLKTQGVSRTTLQFKVPKYLSLEDLERMLSEGGFHGYYDFLNLPFYLLADENRGFAVVNFISHQAAKKAKRKFAGSNQWPFTGEEACQVRWCADSEQGYERNVELNKNRDVMHKDVPDKYKPAVFNHGRRDRFPSPSRPLKSPYPKCTGAQPMAPQTAKA